MRFQKAVGLQISGVGCPTCLCGCQGTDHLDSYRGSKLWGLGTQCKIRRGDAMKESRAELICIYNFTILRRTIVLLCEVRRVTGNSPGSASQIQGSRRNSSQQSKALVRRGTFSICMQEHHLHRRQEHKMLVN